MLKLIFPVAIEQNSDLNLEAESGASNNLKVSRIQLFKSISLTN